jgi:hypothetical protein
MSVPEARFTRVGKTQRLWPVCLAYPIWSGLRLRLEAFAYTLRIQS